MTDQRRNRRWRLLHVPPRGGAENMARDVALMRRARESGEIVFSIYGWERPTLSLGRNQRARGCYDPAVIRALDVGVVRRPTGGRALLHHREVTYSVTAPLDAAESLREWYERINRVLLDGLRRLGVGASVADPSTPAVQPTEIPCFAAPAKGELISDGRKLVGSAQWRDDATLLQHGSILIGDDQSMIPLLAAASAKHDPVPAPATLTEALGRTPLESEVASAMFVSVRDLEDPAASIIEESEVNAMMLEELPHFENELWTWRR